MPSEQAGPRSLRRLLEAVLTVGSELDLQTVLRRIVETAVELVDASYGALGVLNESRTALAEFITVGIDESTHKAIGSLPKGLGLLGALIDDARPLRLPDLGEDPRSSGFPPNHPPMTSFLGVPIRVRNEVFGNLYLTDKRDGEVFTDVDEELTLGLASAAGVAIDNARLFAQVRSRQTALAAMQEVAGALVAGTEPLLILQLVARHARELVAADVATIALPDAAGDQLVMEVADGPAAASLVGSRFPRAGSVSGDVLLTGEPAVLEDASSDHRSIQPQVRTGQIGPALFVALVAEGVPFGTLAVARSKGAVPFSPADLDMVRSFAAQAGVALEQDRVRQQAQRIDLLEDQERIGRDLHDNVIQRIFAVGLSLQATVRLVHDEQAKQRLAAAIDDLDNTVRHIRTVIFNVEAPRSSAGGGVRARILEATAEAGRGLGYEPTVAFSGPIDTLVPEVLADDIVATVREALSNAARHAKADHIEVDLSVAASGVLLRISDNGVGLPPEALGATVGNGLRNMRTRADRLGGAFDLGPGVKGGTVLTWTVPLQAM